MVCFSPVFCYSGKKNSANGHLLSGEHEGRGGEETTLRGRLLQCPGGETAVEPARSDGYRVVPLRAVLSLIFPYTLDILSFVILKKKS